MEKAHGRSSSNSTATRPANGRPGIIRSEAPGSKAQQKLTELLSEANRGVYTDLSPETLGEFLKRWARDSGSINVSAKTLERYQGLIDHQIVPHLGNMPVQKISESDLAALYSRLLHTVPLTADR